MAGLCRLIHTVTEDVQGQLDATRLHPAVRATLLDSLQRTSSDARERLVYCAEAELRRAVQLFEPLPSQLAYPDILEQQHTSSSSSSSSHKSAANINTAASRLLAKGGKAVAGAQVVSGAGEQSAGAGGSASASAGPDAREDVSLTWYPPLRHTLSLLSLLYGTVDPGVFEDLARRGVAGCIAALGRGAGGVRRWRDALHGDLFLVRHLLILREQLLPFDMNLQSVEK